MSKGRFPVKLRALGRLATGVVFLLFGSLAVAAPPGDSYHLIKKITLGGAGASEGRNWDYLTVDAAARRIYISHGTHVFVVDEDQGKVIGEIPDTKGVHGIAIATDLGRGFTSNGQANTVTVFDLSTLKTMATINVPAQNPDSILYDRATKRLFTFNGRSANATAFDAATGQLVGTVPLPGKPETPVLDGTGSIFVNIEDKNSLVEFDSKTLTVKHTYSLAPCEAPAGIAMDTAHRRIFSGCADNKMIAITNADTGKVIATPPIGENTDASAFDAATGLAFASCREGVLTIIHEDSSDKFSVVANVKTEYGAQTMALDPKTHNVYTVTADFGPAPAPTAEEPHPKPAALQGTFRLLVFGR
jgi:DNA-binding beta-propeller fold protein YncE